jgi:hypothetical protein
MISNSPIEEQDDDDETSDLIIIGEAPSTDVATLVSFTLFENGIEGHFLAGEDSVDELRRALEPWPSGEKLAIRRREISRAQTLIGHLLTPAQYWSSAEIYLRQRPTEDLLQILDYADIWPDETKAISRMLLRERHLDYPPEGVHSALLPKVSLLMGLSAGVVGALVMRWPIDRMHRTSNGGLRPHYTDLTREKANRSLAIGVAIWALYVLLALLIHAATA